MPEAHFMLGLSLSNRRLVGCPGGELRLLAVVIFVLGGCGGSPATAVDASCTDGKCDEARDGGSSPTVDASPVERCNGTFPTAWIAGADCANEASIQVHRYDSDTFILRQSICTTFEAPFLYLMIGEAGALLEDTGDGNNGFNSQLVATVDGLIESWAAENGVAEPDLVVINSHGHGDHVQGNQAFSSRANTTVIGTSVGALESFFSIDWPSENGSVDLGSRQITVIPIPGHQAAHVALWDQSKGLLFTGDSLYPGRLFMNGNYTSYRSSMEKLTAAMDGEEICHVLGTHIEMSTTPGEEFPFGSEAHPSEHELRLGREHLEELIAALAAMNGNPVRDTHDDFIIVP